MTGSASMKHNARVAMRSCLVLFFVAALGILSPARADAQIINVQSILATDAKPGLSGSITGAADWRTGNVDLLVMSLAPVARYRSGKHLVLVYGKGELGRSKGARIIARTFEHARYRYSISERLIGELYAQHEYDQFRRLRLRALGGLGPYVKLLDKKSYRVALGVAYMFEREILRKGDEADSGARITSHRLSSYLTGSYKFDDHLQLVQTAYTQPRIDEFSDYRLLSESQLVVQVTTHVAIKTTFVAQYDARPPVGIEKLDTGLKSSVTYSF